MAEAGAPKLALPRLRLPAAGRPCRLLRLQRDLLAGGGLFRFGDRLSVVAGGGRGGGYLCAEQKAFSRFSARDLLLLSAVCGLVRWTLMGWTTELPWLIVAQILHCGTFTVCHLAAMRYISARQGGEVIRLQAVYSAVAMGAALR